MYRLPKQPGNSEATTKLSLMNFELNGVIENEGEPPELREATNILTVFWPDSDAGVKYTSVGSADWRMFYFQ